jgi:hypothetical protein
LDEAKCHCTSRSDLWQGLKKKSNWITCQTRVSKLRKKKV